MIKFEGKIEESEVDSEKKVSTQKGEKRKSIPEDKEEIRKVEEGNRGQTTITLNQT